LQVGHAGTLDPMATGLLIVCVGKATKVVDRYAVSSHFGEIVMVTRTFFLSITLFQFHVVLDYYDL
jgi:hypothetical protein